MTTLRKELVRFGIVGTLGFLIDIGILTVLVHEAGWSPYAARAVAMAVAVTCTWWLHRHWTFTSGRRRSLLPQSLIYGTIQLVGLSVNYGVFSLLVLTGGLWRTFPALAATVGSLCTMGVSLCAVQGDRLRRAYRHGEIDDRLEKGECRATRTRLIRLGTRASASGGRRHAMISTVRGQHVP